MVLHPAEADVGYRFLVSKRGRIVSEIPAHVDFVKNLTLCTVLGDETGVTIGTVEHLLAALRGLSVDNCYIEVDAREVPIMDGSSSAFVDAIDDVGIRELHQPRKFIKVLKPIRVEEGDCWGELKPHSSFHLDIEISYETPLIGRQRYALEMNSGAFRNEIVARAHVRLHARRGRAVEGRAGAGRFARQHGCARRRPGDEPGRPAPSAGVRAPQDAGRGGRHGTRRRPILGSYRSVRGGHRLNAYVLQKLFADAEAWTTVRAPWVRDCVPVDVSAGTAAVNYAADRT